MPDGEHQFINIALAGVRSARSASKQGEPSEPWGDEVGPTHRLHHVYSTVMRLINIYLNRLNSSPNPVFFNALYGCNCYLYQHLRQRRFRAVPLVPLLLRAFLLELVGRQAVLNFIKLMYIVPECPVLHPAGNVAEHLVSAGLARVVDWHAGMLASGGGMERLRAAEKSAKEKRACLYASVPIASTTSKSNGTAVTGQSRVFDATVVRIWSGDQISVIDKDTKKERRIQLSSTRGPKYMRLVPLAKDMCSRIRPIQALRPKASILRTRGKGVLAQETHRQTGEGYDRLRSTT